MAYQVGIDLGTSAGVAAVCRGDGAAHVVPLEGPTGAVASALYLGADGTLLVGEAAERRSLSDPGRVVRELTRRIGDATPLLIGREPVAAADLAARFLARLVDDVARREGEVAARVAVTHPGSWGAHRIGSLRAALAEQGLGSAVLVPEPVAAVASARLASGAVVGVYDLGAGRFEASVVRNGLGGFAPAAPSQELAFGGADLDEVVFAHVRVALGAAWEALDPGDPDVLAAVTDLRRECTAAKEALSRDTEVLVPVALPGVRTQVRLGRAEFEEMIRADVTATVEAMHRALDDAGTSPAELAALVVVGGSARVPLVPQLLGETFGRAVTVPADPAGAVALGAALLVSGDGGRRGVRGMVAVDGSRAASARVAGGDTGRPLRPVSHGAASRPDDRRSAAGAGALPVISGGGEGGTPGPGGPTAAGTTVLPVARPPKQARPFTAGASAAPSRPRRIALVASAGALALAVLGGVVAFGVGRIGAGNEAGAGTPVPVVETGVTGSPAAIPPPPPAAAETRARPGAPPASRRARQAPPPAAPNAPPVTTAPPTTPPPDPKAPPKTAAPVETAAPADEAGGADDADDAYGGADTGGTTGAGADEAGGGEPDGGDAAAAGPAATPVGATSPANDSGAAEAVAGGGSGTQ